VIVVHGSRKKPAIQTSALGNASSRSFRLKIAKPRMKIRGRANMESTITISAARNGVIPSLWAVRAAMGRIVTAAGARHLIPIR